MSLNVHTDIELTPITTKVPVPFVVVFDKKKPPQYKEAASSKSIFGVPQDPTRTQKCSPGPPFAERDPREARERAGKGGPGRTIKCATRQRP